MKQLYKRKCCECEKPFVTFDKSDWLCNSCYRKIQIKISENAKNKDKPKANSAAKQIRFHEIVKAADAEGLSYGKYCLKHGLN